MAIVKRGKLQFSLPAWATFLLDSNWFEVIGYIWKIGKKVVRGFSNEGVYEVLDYESILELKDRQGQKAIFHKREKAGRVG